VPGGVAFAQPHRVVEVAGEELAWGSIGVIAVRLELQLIAVGALQDQVGNIEQRVSPAGLPDLAGERIDARGIGDQVDGNALGQFLQGLGASEVATIAASPVAWAIASGPASAGAAAEITAGSRAAIGGTGAASGSAGASEVGATSASRASAEITARTAGATSAWAASIAAAAGFVEVCITVGRLGLPGPGGEQLEVQIQLDFGLLAHDTAQFRRQADGRVIRALVVSATGWCREGQLDRRSVGFASVPFVEKGMNRRERGFEVAAKESVRLADGKPRHDLAALNKRNPAMSSIGKLMKQAARIQKQLEAKQAELAAKTIEATSGGGAVKVVARCDGTIASIKIDPQAVNPADVTILEDMVLTAANNALSQAKEVQNAEMGSVAGGLQLPGLM